MDSPKAISAAKVGYGWATNLFASFEPGNGREHLLGQLCSFWATVLDLEFLSQSLKLIDSARHAPPCSVRSSGVAFSIYTESCIVLSFDQKITTLVAIRSPRLHRSRLIEVVFVAVLLIRLVDKCFDGFGG